MSGGGSQQVTEKSEPWIDAQPFILEALDNAELLFLSDPEGEDIVADRDPLTLSAELTAETRASNAESNAAGVSAQGAVIEAIGQSRKAEADTQVGVARTRTTEILNGLTTSSDDIFTEVSSKVTPAVNAIWASSGRMGSALAPSDLADKLTSAYAPYALQRTQLQLSAVQIAEAARVSELTTIFQASGLAGTVDEAFMADIKLLNAIGLDREAHAQALINAPYVQALRWLDAAGSAGGFGGTSSRVGEAGSTAGRALGGALSGAAMGAQIGSIIPGVGTAIGAGVGGAIGGLGGLFG